MKKLRLKVECLPWKIRAALQVVSMDVLGGSMNEVRTADWISEHASVAGSRRAGSAAVSSPLGRVDCGMPEGCGTEGSPVRFKIDLKPKGPASVCWQRNRRC